MGKVLPLLFIYLSLISQASLADCTSDLRFLLISTKKAKQQTTDITSIQLKEEINRLENTIDLFRLRKENSEPAIHMYYKKYLAEIDAHLMSENFSVAYRVVRSLFRNVEFSYSYLKEIPPYLADLNKLDKSVLSKEINEFFQEIKLSELEIDLLLSASRNPKTGKELLKQLTSEVESQKTYLAKHFQGYFLIRTHLEDIAFNGGSKTQKLLDSLGSQSYKEKVRFPDFFVSQKRPSLREFQKLVYSDPYMDLIRLKVERNFEVFQAVKSFILQPQILNSIFRGIINIPGMHKTRLVRLFKYIYNTQARELYFPKINRVIRSAGLTDKERLGLLRELNSTTEADDLLITFARRVDTKATESWEKIEKVAKENYPDFATKMDKAKNKAIMRGPISSAFKKSHVGKLAILISSGAAISYFYIDPETSEVPNVTVTELPDEKTDVIEKEKESTDKEVTNPLGNLPEVNKPINGLNQEPFFPNQTRERYDVELREEDLFDIYDEEVQKGLQALESFILRDY